jgi:hypothetical protein
MQAPAIHLRLMVQFPRKDPILFQLGLKAAEFPCFESETKHRSAEALEDNHRLLLQCGNWKFNFFGNCYAHTKSSHNASRHSLVVHGRGTQVQLHRHLAASTRVQLHIVPQLLVIRPRALRQLCRAPRLLVSGCTRSPSPPPCAATTRHPAAQALRQPRRAPRVLVFLPQRLYIDYVVRRCDIVAWAYDYFNYYLD